MTVVYWLAWLGAARAQELAAAPPVRSPEPYATAIRLVERLFLDPTKIDGPAMLQAAADGLAGELDWLMVEAHGSAVHLRHGDGTPIGRVEVHGLSDLPEGLAKLADLVAASGYDTGALDLKVEVLSGMADALDRHTRILAEEGLDRFEVRLSGTLVGIGAGFRWVDDRLLVDQVTDNGPAQQGGLRVEDEILRIDGRSTISMPITEASARVRGEAGTQLALGVRRDGALRSLALTRAEVVVPNVTSRVLPGGVGYVNIDHISQRTVQNLQAALDALQAEHAVEHGLILDLRGNTGGSMKESARAADLFLTEGLLLRTVGRDGGRVQNLQAEMVATDDATEPDVPLVILMNDRTASGSEILAGALVELDRAALIGTRSYGKGTVQTIYTLEPHLRFKMTVARYMLANNRAISGVVPGGPADGLQPDVWIGRVDLDGAASRTSGWGSPAEGADWNRVVPEVHRGTEDPDLALEIARRAVLQTTGSHRADVLGALRREGEVERLEQVQRLGEVLALQGVDWSPAPDGPTRVLDADITVRATRGAGNSWTATATVRNRSARTMYRAWIALSCDTARYWDGLMVPIGKLAPGQTSTRTVTVEVPPGVEPRIDEVQTRLQAEHSAVREFGSTGLESGSSPRPVTRVQARMVPRPDTLGPHGRPVERAEITIENLSRLPIGGVEVRFGYPEQEAIELLDGEARIGELAGRSERTVNLSIELGPGAPRVLPLELQVTSANYGELLRWPIALPVDGEIVRLQAPAIEARAGSLVAPVGPFVLPIEVLDDGGIDHVVVTVNGRKVAWADGGLARVELVAAFNLQPGANRVLIETADNQGINASRRLAVWGEQSADSVDAGP